MIDIFLPGKEVKFYYLDDSKWPIFNDEPQIFDDYLVDFKVPFFGNEATIFSDSVNC